MTLSNHIPSYVSVYNTLYSDIMNHTYEENTLLPSETQLAEKYNVSRNTLRQALAILREDGLIIKSQGKGTIVAKRKENQITKRIFNPLTMLCDLPLTSQEISYNFAPPTDIAREKLRLTKSDIVLAGYTVCRSNATVTGYSFTQITTKALEALNIDSSDRSQIEALLNEKIFEAALTATIDLKLIYANDIEVDHLKVDSGHPLLLSEHILYQNTNEPIARCKFYFIPEFYHLQFQL